MSTQDVPPLYKTHHRGGEVGGFRDRVAALKDCPYPMSSVLKGLKYSGELYTYEGADTFYPTWTQDGRLLSPFTDGVIKGTRAWSTWTNGKRFDAELVDKAPPEQRTVTTGAVEIHGDEISNLDLEVLSLHERECQGYHGEYPCVSVSKDGVWYLGTYYVHNLTSHGYEYEHPDTCYELGPYPGCRSSNDGGKTWEDTPWNQEKTLLQQRGRAAGASSPIFFGSPHAVDLGRNMEHSPDGRAVMLGHGSYDPKGIANWCAGDAVSAARVELSPETINQRSSYEFFCGWHGGEPQFTQDETRAQPILEWKGHCGVANMTYLPQLQRYLGFICVGQPDGSSGAYDTWIVESPTPYGPFATVDYWEGFGSCGYFVCAPSKFLSADNRRVSVFWSANWAFCEDEKAAPHPVGSQYALCCADFELML